MHKFPLKSVCRALVLALCLASAAESQAQIKIGTIDTDRVMKEYSKTKEAEAKLNEAANAAKKELNERAEAYKKALEEINKLNARLDTPALTPEAKASKGKERDEKIASIKSMEREITEFQKTREQQLQQQMLRMRETILKEITEVVVERGKSKNLDLVLDKSGASANRFSPVLFSPESMDFTAEVVGELNKREGATSKANPEKSPAKSTAP